MRMAVPDNLLRSIVDDNRNPSTSPSSMAGPVKAVERRPNVAVEVPLRSPPGIDACDRLMDAADAVDKAELRAKLGALRKEK
jgi:hypothetical protein